MKLGDDKMSKSTGNFITIGEALERFSPDALRLFFLASHYRSPLTYSDESVESQERAADRLRNAVQPTGASDQSEPIEPSEYPDRFVAAMDDDLNTPQALAVLFDLAREINRAAEAGRDVDEAQEELAELAGVLGLTLKPPEGDANRDFLLLAQLVDATIGELTSNGESEAADRMRGRLEEQGIDVKQVLGATSPPVGGDATSADVSALVQTLIESRADLRAAKRFDLADGIRDRLAESGCLLEDTPSGTEWRRSAS
jgi:cysteinyl-tRNA synthetase